MKNHFAVPEKSDGKYEADIQNKARRMVKKVVLRGHNARTKLAIFQHLLGTKAWKERRQLQRQPHVAADAQASRHGHHGAADLTVQHPETIFTRHRQRHMRIRVGAFRNLTGTVPDLQLVLSPIGAVQIELVDRIQSFGRLTDLVCRRG